MSIHALGHFSNMSNTFTHQWFPAFNSFFTDNYLSKHYKVDKIKAKTCNWSTVDYPHDYRAHINSLTVIQPKSSKAIVFTTFYDTGVLYKNIKPILDNFDTVIYSGHYNSKIIEQEWPGNLNNISPWLFRPLSWETPEYSYNPKYERLYFRGLSTKIFRPEVEFLEQIDDTEIDIVSGNSMNYETECQESKICLSLPGIRDMCNRDIELWSRGIPSLRPRFTSELAVNIPDDIYIPVDYSKCSNTEERLKQIINTYLNVRDDDNLLKQISNNSREFYLQNFTPSKLAEFTLDKILTHFD
tara:strand:+ start:146 stop:1042 length:897 start_codon:yes stop_codon:yes gene_type:complete